MTEEVPPAALSEIYLRLLCHDDIDTVKQLCSDWFPIEYPDSWYQDITSNQKFFSLAATYRGTIVGMIVAEIKSRAKVHKEDGDILASGFPVDTQVAYILSLGVVKEFRKHGIGSPSRHPCGCTALMAPATPTLNHLWTWQNSSSCCCYYCFQPEQKENGQFCCPSTAGQWPGCSTPNQPLCSGEKLGTRGTLELRGLLAAETSWVVIAWHLTCRNASLG